MGKIYQAKMSRRESIKRIGSMTAVVMVGGVTVACDTAEPATPESATNPSTGHWPGIELKPIKGPTYGTDPIVSAPTVPWPLTLSEEQKDPMQCLQPTLNMNMELERFNSRTHMLLLAMNKEKFKRLSLKILKIWRI